MRCTDIVLAGCSALALWAGVASSAEEELPPAPTVRSRTEHVDSALVATLQLVRSKEAMHVASLSVARAQFEALHLSAPAGWKSDSSASTAQSIAFSGMLVLQPGKQAVLRFPMSGTAEGSVKIQGLLEGSGGIEALGEAFMFDIVYPCPVWREGPAWGGIPAECRSAGKNK